ncbi:alpha/beta fold hydrolase [Nocardia terpenica]|uniref:esterase/lipase family protein n=1 Tax=Nocardia terpenica TaxID=455432 RepID=UPI0018958F87|nr:alpha/beta fold hydrolase [Nocardia terpenica]MBF6062435.1 alpha/beta fold hydrolase [Nocardia terpenica]MBF6104523.1 alpha/beta fold hydrolase [Nocardia terpenica]MBF6109622.1 alpha/beta fold hydrolase [Nocardia terpenica]MBF6119927.1 alpha/beta fold hydrolase [Nocardia terpenica]MBF6152338.1 alpha/beta fold hydrolase [Nocardia terpenica]
MRRLPGTMLIMAVLTTLWLGSATTARAEYPVVYNFFAGIPDELAHPGGSLPGSNDRSCRPSAAHPDPVVLVHGTGGGAQTNWGAYVPLLANAGYCVFALTYGAYDLPWPISAIGGMQPIESSAAQLAAFVDRVRAETGAARVDLIGHSQGNIVGNYYIKRLGGAGRVHAFVAIAAPWLGTDAFSLGELTAFTRQLGVGPQFEAAAGALCHACAQMLKGSDFMRGLLADGVYDPSVTYTNIETRYDELVVPPSIALVPGPRTTNVLVQDGCPADLTEHAGIAGSARAAAFARNALDPAHPVPVPCHPALPLVGG